MRFVTIILLCSLCAIGNPELCSPNVTMTDMPEGILKSMISMAVGGTVIGFTGCSDEIEIEPDKVGFWLYNKQNPDTPILLNRENPTQINPGQKIIFITHGWTCNITGDGFPDLKNAYLKRYPDSNVILIEWATYSVDLYIHSFCFVPKIAEVFGKFVCNLKAKYDVDVSQLHLVGHSMGGQISGLTGQETLKQCDSKIGRITALDPAGPIYQQVSESRRLDAKDAVTVDVIHSNQGQCGYFGSCGTVDYYPNCGFLQPGCIKLTPTTNITTLLNLPFRTFSCSHQRSIELMVESILSEGFKAKSCQLCPGLPPGQCVADVIFQTTSTMGEDHTKTPGTAAKYYLTTHDKSPFAKL